jgi:hypothetical protein
MRRNFSDIDPARWNPQLWFYKWIGYDKKQRPICISNFNQWDPADCEQVDSIETRGAFCSCNNQQQFVIPIRSGIEPPPIFLTFFILIRYNAKVTVMTVEWWPIYAEGKSERKNNANKRGKSTSPRAKRPSPPQQFKLLQQLCTKEIYKGLAIYSACAL